MGFVKDKISLAAAGPASEWTPGPARLEGREGL